jgi:hypothetical protein
MPTVITSIDIKRMQRSPTVVAVGVRRRWDRGLEKGSYMQNTFSSGFEDFAYKATVGLRVAHPIG